MAPSLMLGVGEFEVDSRLQYRVVPSALVDILGDRTECTENLPSVLRGLKLDNFNSCDIASLLVKSDCLQDFYDPLQILIAPPGASLRLLLPLILKFCRYLHCGPFGGIFSESH